MKMTDLIDVCADRFYDVSFHDLIMEDVIQKLHIRAAHFIENCERLSGIAEISAGDRFKNQRYTCFLRIGCHRLQSGNDALSGCGAVYVCFLTCSYDNIRTMEFLSYFDCLLQTRNCFFSLSRIIQIVSVFRADGGHFQSVLFFLCQQCFPVTSEPVPEFHRFQSCLPGKFHALQKLVCVGENRACRSDLQVEQICA